MTPRVLLTLILVGWIGALAVSFVAVPKLVLDGFDGVSLDVVNQRIDGHRRAGIAEGQDRSRQWYANWARAYALKATVLASGLAAAAAAFVGLSGFRKQLRRFVFAPAAPLNLAVLRVTVFGMLLMLLCTEPIREYAGWDRAAFQWPSVSGPLLSRLPISPELVDRLLPVAIVAASLAAVGMFTRTSGWISCLLAIYLLGIPQCSGKVNHSLHHIILIGLLLSCSRCGDALSFDSLFQAFGRADRGQVRQRSRSILYGTPIRLAMLLLATCYFFPGFWKLSNSGLDWIFGGNLQNQLMQKWFELETYRPPLPVHHLPGFSAAGALFAIVFEVGFPLAILWRRPRALWGALGLIFHNTTWLLMKISFLSMQAMYVMFVDWQRLLKSIGRRLLGPRLVLLYDGNCKLCRRTMALLASLDWLKQLRLVNALDRDRIMAIGLDYLDEMDLATDIHAAARGAEGDGNGAWTISRGYAAYQTVAWRVPLLWPIMPVLYLAPVVAIGKKIYRRIADSRTCSIARPPEPSTQTGPSLLTRLGPILAVAAMILAPQFVLGMGRVRTAWPVSCYPLFDTLSTDTVRWPEFETTGDDGVIVILDDDPIRDFYTESRYVPAMKSFTASSPDTDELGRMVEEYLKVWQRAELIDQPPEAVRVYIATYKLTGAARPQEPARRELLFVYEPQSSNQDGERNVVSKQVSNLH